MPLYPNLANTYAKITEIDARTFGVVADGATDGTSLTANTAALQAFIDYIQTNELAGVLPDGIININAKINFAILPNWSVRGLGRGSTFIKQHTDNVPILDLGTSAGSYLHTFAIRDLAFTYLNSQAAANTSANPILFSAMAFNGDLRNVAFSRGSYAIRVASGIGCPWGTSWDDLMFDDGLTLGAMDWSAGINATPNNAFGRMTIKCTNMTGPVFKLRGYNFTIDTLEFLSASNGPKLIELAAGGQVDIGTVKLENGTYGAAQTLFDFLAASQVRIGHVSVGGTSMAVTPSSGSVKIFQIGSGGGEGSLEIGHVTADTSSNSGVLVVAAGASPSRVRIEKTALTNGWQLTDNASATTSEIVTVDAWQNGHLSADKGNADYTVALGDPNIVHFQTAFTAARTVTLPSTGNLLFNGLTYDIIVDGAINGTNYLAVVAGATTHRTQTRDKVRIRCVWRRHTTAALGWVVTAVDLFEAPPWAPAAAGKAASYHIAWGGATGTRALTDAQEVAVPLFWGGTAVDRLGVEVTTLAASTNIRLGIRHSLGGYPDALILDAGTIDASTTGIKEITIAQALPKGAYYLTCTAQGGAPTIRSSAAAHGLGPFLPNSTVSSLLTANPVGYARNGISGALPATFASPVIEGGNGPRLFVRGA